MSGTRDSAKRTGAGDHNIDAAHQCGRFANSADDLVIVPQSTTAPCTGPRADSAATASSRPSPPSGLEWIVGSAALASARPGAAVADRHRGALVEEPFGNRSPDASCRGADQDFLAGEFEVHFRSLNPLRPLAASRWAGPLLSAACPRPAGARRHSRRSRR